MEKTENVGVVEDIHICGACRVQFNDVELFLKHKRAGCLSNESLPAPLSNESLPAPTAKPSVNQETLAAPVDLRNVNLASEFLKTQQDPSEVALNEALIRTRFITAAFQQPPKCDEAEAAGAQEQIAIAHARPEEIQQALQLETSHNQLDLRQLEMQQQIQLVVPRIKDRAALSSETDVESTRQVAQMPVESVSVSDAQLISLSLDRGLESMQQLVATNLSSRAVSVKTPSIAKYQQMPQIELQQGPVDITLLGLGESYLVGSTSNNSQNDNTSVYASSQLSEPVDLSSFVGAHTSPQSCTAQNMGMSEPQRIHPTTQSSTNMAVYSTSPLTSFVSTPQQNTLVTTHAKNNGSNVIERALANAGVRSPGVQVRLSIPSAGLAEERPLQNTHVGGAGVQVSLALPGPVLPGDVTSNVRLQKLLQERSLPPSNISTSQVESVPAKTSGGVKAKKEPTQKSPLPKKFHCKYDGCRYTTAYQKDLDRHTRIHTGEKPFQCNVCSKAFNRMDKLKLHHRSHTGTKPHQCPHCKYSTADNSSLKKHLRVHTGERPYKCQICPYASRNSSQLTVHLRTHTGDSPYVCYHCSARFKINSDLKRHIRMHTGEKPFQCEYCDYKCAIKGNLKTHYRINHSSYNVNTCEKCGFQTSSRKAFKDHTKTHEPTRTFQCDQCAYTCTSETTLRMHARVHTDDKPFQCQFCTYCSRQNSNVKTHMKRKHPSSSVCLAKASMVMLASDQRRDDKRRTQVKPVCKKMFKCTQCEASFVREDSMRCHMRCHREAEQALAQSIEKSGISDMYVQQQEAEPVTAANVGTVRRRNLSDRDVHPGHASDSSLSQVTINPAVASVEAHNPASVDRNRNLTSHSHIEVKSHRKTAVLSQLASNKLAVIQNVQNSAVEDNMHNLAAARDAARIVECEIQHTESDVMHVESDVVHKQSTQMNTQKQNNLHLVDGNYAGEVSDISTSQHAQQILQHSQTLQNLQQELLEDAKQRQRQPQEMKSISRVSTSSSASPITIVPLYDNVGLPFHLQLEDGQQDQLQQASIVNALPPTSTALNLASSIPVTIQFSPQTGGGTLSLPHNLQVVIPASTAEQLQSSDSGRGDLLRQICIPVSNLLSGPAGSTSTTIVNSIAQQK